MSDQQAYPVVDEGAPTAAEYIVKTTHSGLSAERVATDSATVTLDWSTPGVVKWVAAAIIADGDRKSVV